MLNLSWINSFLKTKSLNLEILIFDLLARDVLVIPMSSVASEYVFSTGGRILYPFRSSYSQMCAMSYFCPRLA
uniref:HAT C-terminal dimerisation domain-containing protein n=1 Tax=Solanum lycopersicum TaxID=4081 RepID=A0A3Q7GFT0_SOLLC